MQHLSESELESLRAALDAEHTSLEEELAMYGKKDITTGEWEGSSADETTMEEADPSDAADQIEELVVNIPLVAELQKRMHEIDAAIDKMDNGTYGICEAGREEIEFDRLEANPAAKTCVAHA